MQLCAYTLLHMDQKRMQSPQLQHTNSSASKACTYLQESWQQDSFPAFKTWAYALPQPLH
jgi:hypothetical protein